MYGFRLILQLSMKKKYTPGCLPFICGDRQFPGVKTIGHVVMNTYHLHGGSEMMRCWRSGILRSSVVVLVIESVDVGIEIEHAVWIGRAP